jgi:aryl sulfotransferase
MGGIAGPGPPASITFFACAIRLAQHVVLPLRADLWDARNRPNVFMVHYNDLKADLAGEMRRIAHFLSINVDEGRWPEFVEAAGFEAMRRDGPTLMSSVASIFKGGSERFFFEGTNQRWRGRVSDEDLALYEAKAEEMFPPDCARWVYRVG